MMEAADSSPKTVRSTCRGVGPSEGVDYIIYEDGSVKRKEA